MQCFILAVHKCKDLYKTLLSTSPAGDEALTRKSCVIYPFSDQELKSGHPK